MLLKILHRLSGFGVGVLFSTSIDTNINTLLFGIGLFTIFFAIVVEYVLYGGNEALWFNLVGDSFVTALAIVPFKRGEQLVQALCVSYLLGLIYLSLLVFQYYANIDCRD
jgi:Na+-translocating ferredoxin:NAD+ oxidoreductase RnfD subunit